MAIQQAIIKKFLKSQQENSVITLITETNGNLIRLGNIKDNKVTVYDKPMMALLPVINLTDYYEHYCNTTGKKIIRNDYFIYVDDCIINNSRKINEEDYKLSYNIDSKQEPEYVSFMFIPILTIKLTHGTIYILKYLDNITVIP